MLTPELIGYCVVSFIAGGAVTLGACLMYHAIKHERQMRAMEAVMSGEPAAEWKPAADGIGWTRERAMVLYRPPKAVK